MELGKIILSGVTGAQKDKRCQLSSICRCRLWVCGLVGLTCSYFVEGRKLERGPWGAVALREGWWNIRVCTRRAGTLRVERVRTKAWRCGGSKRAAN